MSLAAKRSDWDAPSLPLFEKEFAAALAREIEKLPPQCKVVFLKSRVEEKKNAEIAIELGVSIKAVESQITKALKLLRQNLAQHMTAVGLLLLYDQTVLYG